MHPWKPGHASVSQYVDSTQRRWIGGHAEVLLFCVSDCGLGGGNWSGLDIGETRRRRGCGWDEKE